MNLLQAIEKHDIHASPHDGADYLLETMEVHGFNALPVVADGLFQGLVLADQLLDAEDPTQVVKDLKLPYTQLFLHQDQHIFDALPFFEANQANVLPVINAKHGYLGLITPCGLLRAIAHIMDSDRPGSILVLEVGQRDNALSHIAHTIETADAQVLSSFTRVIPDSTRLEITLKVSATNLSGVVATLLRHDYLVKTTYSQEPDTEGINARFEHLMNYINM